MTKIQFYRYCIVQLSFESVMIRREHQYIFIFCFIIIYIIALTGDRCFFPYGFYKSGVTSFMLKNF